MEFISAARGVVGRTLAALVLLSIMAVALAGCGDTASSSGGQPTSVPAATVPPAGGVNDLTPTAVPAGGGTAEQVKVDLKEWAVVPDPAQLTAGKQSFTVTNSGTLGHDLVIFDSTGAEVGRTPVFRSADGTKTLEADLKAGTYKFICDVPGHADQGMKVDVTVK